MANIFGRPKNGREEIAKDQQQKPPPENDSLLDRNVPCESPYPKTRHPRLPFWEMDVPKHIDKNHKDLLKDFPFPDGKVRDEFARYEDGDLARLVDNCYRACWILTRMISQPLTEEALHYYVYVPFPCRIQFQRLYKGQDVKISSSDVPMEWPGTTEVLSYIDKYMPEPLVELILTDLSYRNNNLANQVEQLCKKVVIEATQADDYFGRLTKYTPAWWNKNNYIDRIRKFRSCLTQLLEKLNHIGQLYENELKGTENRDVKKGSANEKTSESWLWKLFEKTIKAAFDAILDKLNPS